MFGFEIRSAFLVLLLAAQIFGDSLPHQSHNITSVKLNSADNSPTVASAHGPKLIQSVPSTVVDHPHPHPTKTVSAIHADNFTDLVRLQDVLTVFDLDALAEKWPTVQHEFKSGCRQDMTEYFRGLQLHKLWATKSKYNLSVF